MSRVRLSADGCLEPRPCFAGLDALVPRVMKLCVTRTSAVSEPRTTATATTHFPRFLDGAAFRACGTDNRCRGCWCLYAGTDQNPTKTTQKNKDCLVCARIYLHAVRLELTFASLHALKPAVTNVSVARTSAVFKPSTARSATAVSAGFLECAAFGARHRFSDCCGDGWRVG